MTTRRSFLASILAAGMAPAAVGSGILMPVKKIIAPWFLVIPGSDFEEMTMPVDEYLRANPIHMEIGHIERFRFITSPLVDAERAVRFATTKESPLFRRLVRGKSA